MTPAPENPPAFPRSETTVVIDGRTADLVRKVFLPRNPNKLRNTSPEVVHAAKDFIEAEQNGHITLVEWTAIRDALIFTAQHSGCVSDAHNRAADIVLGVLAARTQPKPTP